MRISCCIIVDYAILSDFQLFTIFLPHRLIINHTPATTTAQQEQKKEKKKWNNSNNFEIFRSYNIHAVCDMMCVCVHECLQWLHLPHSFKTYVWNYKYLIKLTFFYCSFRTHTLFCCFRSQQVCGSNVCIHKKNDNNGYQLNEFKLHYYHMIELMNGMHTFCRCHTKH